MRQAIWAACSLVRRGPRNARVTNNDLVNTLDVSRQKKGQDTEFGPNAKAQATIAT
jgi:hypothetical protein